MYNANNNIVFWCFYRDLKEIGCSLSTLDSCSHLWFPGKNLTSFDVSTITIVKIFYLIPLYESADFQLLKNQILSIFIYLYVLLDLSALSMGIALHRQTLQLVRMAWHPGITKQALISKVGTLDHFCLVFIISP